MKKLTSMRHLYIIIFIALLQFILLSNCSDEINDPHLSHNNDIEIINGKIFRANNLEVKQNYDIRTTGSWLKGDLHLHSKFSGNEKFPEGSKLDNGDRTVGEMLDIAREKDFDFISITDHDFLPDFMMFHPQDTYKISPPSWTDPEYMADDLVLIYGIEYTAIGGHANIWHSTIFDYGRIWRSHNFINQNYKAIFLNFLLSIPNWDDVADAAHNQGALFSINHPSEGWINKRPETFDTMEIWNAPFYLVDRFNRNSVNNIWQKYLSSGRRVSGVGGSDKHRFNNSYGYQMGQPSTWVFSKKKDSKSILEAIKAGHVSISYTSEAGYLEFTADANNDGIADILSGDNITTNSKKTINFIFRYVEKGSTEIEGDFVEISMDKISSPVEGINMLDEYIHTKNKIDSKILVLYKNGKRYKAWILKNNCNMINFSEIIEPHQRDYYRIELFGKTNWPIHLRSMGGKIIGITNPIYINY